MEKQYNGILFFNDKVYLVDFINYLVNIEPTEENFKYLAHLVALIEKDGNEKMDVEDPAYPELAKTEAEVAQRFTAAAEQLIIDIASKKYPDRDFEFRILAEENIRSLSMPTLDNPLFNYMSVDEKVEALPDELNPFKGGSYEVNPDVEIPDDPIFGFTRMDEKVDHLPDDQNVFKGGSPMRIVNPNPEIPDHPMLKATQMDEKVEPVPDEYNPFKGGQPMVGQPVPKQDYYDRRFPNKPQVPTRPLIANPTNNMDAYYNQRFPVTDEGNQMPDNPEMGSGRMKR